MNARHKTNLKRRHTPFIEGTCDAWAIEKSTPSRYDIFRMWVAGVVAAMKNNASQADLIPNWAAFVFVCGTLFAAIGFTAAWFTDSGFATLIMTIGLGMMAISMHAAENVSNSESSHL